MDKNFETKIAVLKEQHDEVLRTAKLIAKRIGKTLKLTEGIIFDLEKDNLLVSKPGKEGRNKGKLVWKITYDGKRYLDKEVARLEQIKQFENAKSVRTILMNNLNNLFDIADIKVLCFEMEIDYAQLPGETKREKVIGLIGYFENRDQVQNLWEKCKKARPNATWE